ncbi:inorganic phosphate transporter [Ruminiclostridium cellobioparum]|jgi:inorganic phosphate transporter, PiT family|uniref:Phosphate/sulfate permease n=1 Tax=Ruminiclostridium cellobioparum subsp. termitidis CT1112 TaxID=1195236 RepID=S0FFH3_RUMCE|nr:inorganic phosphate transporter [Ruminiclostridium cellobioparum]EMS69675.1 phosphate/sulfate permease [Ruminiclostridium cellobioparum subsp. termitidis CT1112]
MLSVSLVAVVVLALGFDFINGFHDTANSIATSVSTRVLSPRQAILMSAVLNFVGALTSSKVAHTITNGLVDGDMIKGQYVIIATIIAAIIWDLITWYFGIPSSSSHALIGALVGSAIAYSGGISIVKWQGVWEKVVLPLVTSPFIGFGIGFLFMTLLYKLLRNLTPRFINKWFSKLQIISAAFMAYSHGNNDAQKSMGIITLALVGAGLNGGHTGVQPWVMVACALSMALGTSIGGWKIIKTIGVNMIRLQPIGGFAAETGAAIVIETMTHFGAPVSTTHVISSSIMGVGASKRLSAVKWSLVRNIVWAWVITIPVSALIGAFITTIFKLFI